MNNAFPRTILFFSWVLFVRQRQFSDAVSQMIHKYMHAYDLWLFYSQCLETLASSNSCNVGQTNEKILFFYFATFFVGKSFVNIFILYFLAFASMFYCLQCIVLYVIDTVYQYSRCQNWFYKTTNFVANMVVVRDKRN